MQSYLMSGVNSNSKSIDFENRSKMQSFLFPAAAAAAAAAAISHHQV
jgi:hypothetical protein